MKKSSKIKVAAKKLLSSTLITTMLLGGITATDIYYGYAPHTAEAASLTGTNKTVSLPAFNAANIPSRDTTGTVSYWYAGNEFHALNQITDGVQQNASGTSGHLKVYSDSNGARLVETTANNQKAVKGNFSGGSDFDLYTKESSNPTSATIWELMDTDAVWDDQYLFAQYKTNAFSGVTTSFAPTILTAVESWYDNGFSYDGSQNGRPTIAANGKSWFSSAEKSAVKSAKIKTDGVNGSNNTTTNDTISNAHLFAASIDEMYYNPVQVEQVIANLAADQSTTYNAASWQCARSNLWSRSFWGVYSNGYRNGFDVSSSGQVSYGHVAHEFGVAPAFYLDLSKVVMARSAKNAATSVAASTGLKTYDAKNLDTSKGVKFLVKDSSFAPSFSSSIHNKSGIATIGSTYSVDYSGATTSKVNDPGTGAELVISAALYDQSGKIVYYGPLSKVTSASGNVSLQIPSGIAEGTYTLALFEEQLGGTSSYDTTKNSKNGTSFSGSKHTYNAYETDYQSGSIALMSLNVVNDYHTGIELTNNNDTDMSTGDSVVSSAVSGTFTSLNNTLNGAIPSDDIYVIAASDWEANMSANNTHLAHSIQIPEEAVSNFEYYVVVKDLSVTNEYFASAKYIIDCSENQTGFDETTWYSYEDKTTGITWKYKLDGNGDIIGLYTKSSIVKIVDGGGTLNIPAKVAGRTVVKIGGGTEDTTVIPASETSWTSLSLPATVTTINDFAFYKSKADANVTIPSNVTAIGVKAFYESNVLAVKVSEMNGTIGSYAFGKTPKLGNVSIKGGNHGLVISTVGFADSAVTSVTIKGNVTVNKKAFRNNASLETVNINGNVSLKEYAFTDCPAVTSFLIHGTTNIESYALNGMTSLQELYLPVGTTLHEYSMNGCTGLLTLETDVNLPAHSFENTGNINKLILDNNVVSVSYDWEGHASTASQRTIYIKNDTMQLGFYGKDNVYHSAFGSSGNITVYIPNTSIVDLGATVRPNDDGVLTINGYTGYAHSGNDVYGKFIKGTASSVTMRAVNNLDTQMEKDGVTSVKDNEAEHVQTGIDAYYSSTILTTKDINKDKMTVVRTYGSDEGEAYTSAEFYVVRTTEFNEEEKKQGGVTEEAIASYEPVHANADDLDNGASIGTISVTVVVFYDAEVGGSTVRKYYSTPVSIRIEEYTDKDFIESEYESYTAIVNKINGLTGEIENMEDSMKSVISDINAALGTNFDVNATDLTAEYQKAVNAISNALTNAITKNNSNIAEVKALIASVNAIYGTSIQLADDATTEQINAAISEALRAINADQTEKNNTIRQLKEEYVAIARLLSDYMSDTENLEADAVNGTTVADIKTAIAKAMGDLNKANKELSDIDVALNNLFDTLKDAIGNMPMTSEDGNESAADKINSITGMVGALSASYELNNSYLRDCIAQINQSFGYGSYVKYNDKYVFYIINTKCSENGMPEYVYYVKTSPRTYLDTSDGATFTEYSNQDAARAAFDSVEGAKFFHVTDTEHGWNPLESNPLNEYKKAMSALLTGFNSYDENTVTLIATVNSICGYQEGDGNYISIPENASTADITNAKERALKAINTQMSVLNTKNNTYATQYAEAAKALNEFLSSDYGENVSAEQAAEITEAARRAVAELSKIRGEMNAVDAALANLFKTLSEAFENMGMGADMAGDGDVEC